MPPRRILPGSRRSTRGGGDFAAAETGRKVRAVAGRFELQALGFDDLGHDCGASSSSSIPAAATKLLAAWAPAITDVASPKTSADTRIFVLRDMTYKLLGNLTLHDDSPVTVFRAYA